MVGGTIADLWSTKECVKSPFDLYAASDLHVDAAYRWSSLQ